MAIAHFNMPKTSVHRHGSLADRPPEQTDRRYFVSEPFAMAEDRAQADRDCSAAGHSFHCGLRAAMNRKFETSTD